MVIDVTRGANQGFALMPRRPQMPVRRDFAGMSDPMVSIGAAGAASYNSGTNPSLTCPDCPTDCSSVDEVVTMFVSPQQASPNDKQIPVIRTGRVCNDTELDIDCDNSSLSPTLNGVSLRGLGNANDNAVGSSDAILVQDPSSAAPQEAGMSGTLLLVGGVALITALATVALTGGSSRRRN